MVTLLTIAMLGVDWTPIVSGVAPQPQQYVTFYSRPDCIHCPAVEHQLASYRRNGRPLLYRKVHAERGEVPRVEWDGRVVVGNDPRAIKQLLDGDNTNVRTEPYRSYPEMPDNSLPADAQPTPWDQIHEALRLLGPKPSETFVDFGCGGDARVVITAVRRYGCKGIGVEIDAERAAEARRAVEDAGLAGRIEIIHGDATDDFSLAYRDWDVGYAYLWPDVLGKLKPAIKRLDRFVSYAHEVPGLNGMQQHGDCYLWTKPRVVEQRPVIQQQRGASWGGRIYSAPVCNSRNCAMCNAIRRGLGW